jgi:hypothetical protein
MNGFRKYVASLIDPVMAIPASKVAVVVGTILFFINHAPALFTNQMTWHRWLSVFLSYIVPYMVSVHGRFSAKDDGL